AARRGAGDHHHDGDRAAGRRPGAKFPPADPRRRSRAPRDAHLQRRTRASHPSLRLALLMDGALLHNVILGLETAVDPANLVFCFFGVFLGMAIGVLPGIGPLATISMLFPITFYLPPTTALIMLAGIYYGSAYGGSTTAILLNVPGSPSAAVACLDGYPMARQGRAGIALLLTTVGSFIGGSIGIILMMLFSPVIAAIALDFGPAEYFSLMVLGLVAASTIASGSAIKGLAMVVLGILLGLVGSDIYTGASRYTFGVQELYDGISLVALSMGL